MPKVTPRADIKKIREAQFPVKSEFVAALKAAKKPIDVKSVTKIENGHSVNERIFENYRSILNLSLDEAVDNDEVATEKSKSYSINEQNILASVCRDFGWQQQGRTHVISKRAVALPLSAKEFSALNRETQDYEIPEIHAEDELIIITTKPFYFIHDDLIWDDALAKSMRSLSQAIKGESEAMKGLGTAIFRDLDAMADEMELLHELEGPINDLYKNHDVHILGARLTTLMGHMGFVDSIGYQSLTFPFFVIAPQACREASLVYNALGRKNERDWDDCPF